MNKKISFIITIACLAMLPHIATDIYVPSLPIMVLDLHSSNETIQLTLTFYLFFVTVGQLFFGPISDRYGRNNIIMLGIMIAIVATTGCIYSTTATTLIAWRCLQGVGLGALAASARAILPDHFSGLELVKYAAIVSAMAPVLIGMAPMLGGHLQVNFGWQSNFVFILIFAVLLMFVVVYKMPSSKQILHNNINVFIVLRNYRKLLGDSSFMAYSLCTFFGFAGLTAYFASATFLLQNIVGLNAAEFGNLSLITGGVSFVTGMTASLLVTRLGINKMLFIGALLMFSAAIAMLIPAIVNYVNTWVIAIPAAFYMAGLAIITPVSGAAAFTLFREISGSVSALSGSLRVFGAALGSAIIAIAPETSQMPLALVYLGASSMVLLLLWYIVATGKGVRNE